MTCEVVPRLITLCSRNVNARKSAMARMISGTMNDSSIVNAAPLGSLPRHRSIPMANSTPSGTAISMVSPASRRLCTSAVRSSGLYQSDSAAARLPTHHRSEKPCQLVRERPALNENAMAITTGTIDQTT